MNEEFNPVKEYLFEYIKKSESEIKKKMSEQKYAEIIEDIISQCYDEITSIGPKEEALPTLATGILHYLLTNTLIKSQRKVKKDGIEIDIIIPDLKTLEKDPKRTLIIYIPTSYNRNNIEVKLDRLGKIQPEKQNIWVVLAKNMPLNHKTYMMEKENNTFSKIIFDIAQFVNISGQNKFKILKI